MVVGSNTAEMQVLTKVFAVLMKLCGAEKAIIRVLPVDGDTDIRSLRLQEHFTMESVAGGSGQLVMDEKKGAAMVK